jgi:N-acetylglucosaminyldiphosphoundecaprenol N-acetyl-beta-D-mannosaminyltransferase
MAEAEGGRRDILGVPVDSVTYAETLGRIAGFVSSDRLHQICTVNPEFVMTAQRDPDFMAILNQADLCIPDGIGLLWAARRMGEPLKERVAGSDLIWLLAERAAREGWRLFLLGGWGDVSERCAAILTERYPALQVVGTYAGSPREDENAAIVERVNASRADVLLVAYGAPAQDKWTARNRGALPTVRAAIGVGGSFDFVTGEAMRAPRWIQRLGLEWLHRLLREPWRWRRQLALPRFVLAVLLRGRR